jgi:hypothetical protein
MATEAYNRALAEAKAGRKRFEPGAVFLPDADCVRFIARDRAYNGEWIDPYVTLYFDRRTGEPVGFKIKCVRTLIAELRKRGKSGRVTFADILNVVDEVAEATEQAKKQRNRARESELADVEIPREALA